MGQGCSTTSRILGDPSPDPVMRALTERSLAATDRLCGHGGSGKRAGQGHLLYRNRGGSASGHHHHPPPSPAAKPRIRGSKIAEGFGTNAGAPRRHPSPVRSAPGQGGRGERGGERETVRSECPTSLWLRRRPLPTRRKRFSHGRVPEGHDPGDVTVLGEGGYRPAAGSAAGSASAENTTDTTGGGGDEPPPPPGHSTHIYAIRYPGTGAGPERALGDAANRPRSVPGSRGGRTRESRPRPGVPPPGDPGTAPPAGKREAAAMFGPDRMAEPPKREVLDWVTVSEEHSIYVVEMGLSGAECDAIVTTTEEVCSGRYAAYTYAKQTLGCKEYPALAEAALGPVHSMAHSIVERLETTTRAPPGKNGSTEGDGANAKPGSNNNENNNGGTTDASVSSPTTPPPRRARELRFDEREPHIVKYDVTKKERQKLDMHTDKSEWTFLIALSNGCGVDYEGGGTYFECLDATIHVQKGHSLVFPGKLRHKGQAITGGLRFLLVGFLVDGAGKTHKNAATAAASKTAALAFRAADPAGKLGDGEVCGASTAEA
mmetsp:Transcript_7921/g.16339  ORF Transcript_7921/g.16339 Transcript_7921/m.16339 type:complete len:545 (+) Transcript_7921:1314-2948(+)